MVSIYSCGVFPCMTSCVWGSLSEPAQPQWLWRYSSQDFEDVGPHDNLILGTRNGLTLAGSFPSLGVPMETQESWITGDLLRGVSSTGASEELWLSASSDLLLVSEHVAHSHHPPSGNSAPVHLQLCLQYPSLKWYLLPISWAGRGGALDQGNQCPPFFCLAGKISL